MSQPLYFARLAQLLLELGDQSPELGQFERSISPVVIVGDGSEVVPPLFAARSLSGGVIGGGGTGATHAGFQLLARSPGGLRVRFYAGSPSSGNIQTNITNAPNALAGAVPGLNLIQVDPGANFTLNLGTMTLATAFPAGTPQYRIAGNTVAKLEVIIPNGFTLQVAHSSNAATFNLTCDIKDLAVGARL